MSDYPLLSGHTITIRPTGISGYDLIGPDGEVFAWASDSLTRPLSAAERRPPATPKCPTDPATTSAPAVTPRTLCGPFTVRPGVPGEYEIVGGNGTPSVRVVGGGNADFLVKLLNLAHKHGKV